MINFCVSENFQKSPGGLLVATRRRIPVLVFFGFLWGTAWRWSPVPHGGTSLQPSFWVS